MTRGHGTAGKDRRAVVLGASAGGLEALASVLGHLSEGYPFPILAVIHRAPTEAGRMSDYFAARCRIRVEEPCPGEPARTGRVYLAPADYHLLAERDGTLSLSMDEKVNFSRPSIDVLFESAARAWGAGLIGVLLTGSNGDGTSGMLAIRKAGGLTMAQDPRTAEHPFMPRAAIEAGGAERVLPLEAIGPALNALAGRPGS